MPRTSANIAAVRAKLMEEMDAKGSPYNMKMEVRDHLSLWLCGNKIPNPGGTVALDVQGCSYKTFMNGKPHSFSGTEGVVIALYTFESRALAWWNGNVQTLGLANANQIPWSNVKAMMTTEYCPATEIQRMEQELWTLTLKGDDIEAYNNRFHELVLMCPELVSTEKKKIEKVLRGFPEGIKGNVTSSKPATLHDAINMARELIEQGVQAKALRIGDSNKRKWEDQQGNNYHQQQNQRQEAAKVYVAAPAKGRGFTWELSMVPIAEQSATEWTCLVVESWAPTGCDCPSKEPKLRKPSKGTESTVEWCMP
ncbi:putative reverse transcriptase domain-containing protein [Tanacetum coccineum]|uniref:Reverse transcriptase domain-containing protein n=1 Tax=Tanacetum coccineum TaxID=301880 RepID=A0ABQ5FJU6_9ASTR